MALEGNVETCGSHENDHFLLPTYIFLIEHCARNSDCFRTPTWKNMKTLSFRVEGAAIPALRDSEPHITERPRLVSILLT